MPGKNNVLAAGPRFASDAWSFETKPLMSMIKPKLHAAGIALLVAAVFALPSALLAQTNAKPAKPAADKKQAAEKNETAEKKPSAGPFHGKLAAMDKTAKTISVGKRTFQITSETKMFKAGKPATLDEGVVGEEVSGYVKPTDDGKLVATKVNFGPKKAAEEAKGSEKKKEEKKKEEKKQEQ
jgi:hypothetical protein